MTLTRKAVQSYRERLPVPELVDRVATVWTLDVAAGGPAYEHRTVPNGCVELSYAIGADVLTVSGPQRGPTLESVAPRTTLVGIRFRPGAGPPILGVPASELLDTRVELDQLWGRAAASLAERLAAAASPDVVAGLLQHEILTRSAGAVDSDPLVRAALGRLQPWRRTDVGTATADLFISSRQLRRRFGAALGYGPKTFQRVARFQGFLAVSQLARGERRPLAWLARVAGYADQAHLTKESSELAGLTPLAFLEETSRSCGADHDHEASYAGLRRALLAPPRAA